MAKKKGLFRSGLFILMFCFFPQHYQPKRPSVPVCSCLQAGLRAPPPTVCRHLPNVQVGENAGIILQCAIRIVTFPGSEMGNTGPSLHLMYEDGTVGDIDGPAVGCVETREDCVPLVGLNLGAARGCLRDRKGTKEDHQEPSSPSLLLPAPFYKLP